MPPKPFQLHGAWSTDAAPAQPSPFRDSVEQALREAGWQQATGEAPDTCPWCGQPTMTDVGRDDCLINHAALREMTHGWWPTPKWHQLLLGDGTLLHHHLSDLGAQHRATPSRSVSPGGMQLREEYLYLRSKGLSGPFTDAVIEALLAVGWIRSQRSSTWGNIYQFDPRSGRESMLGTAAGAQLAWECQGGPALFGALPPQAYKLFAEWA